MTSDLAFQPLATFLAGPGEALSRGPVAIILIEDEVEIASTLRHHIDAGFRRVLALSQRPVPAHLRPDDPKGRLTWVQYDTRQPNAHVEAVNAVIRAVPAGTWLYYGYNAEYLFHPFSETRNVAEMLAFHAEERRDAMLTYVIDLYASDLQVNPNAVDQATAMFDREGYYALARADRRGITHDRQLDFFGGLRWRFEEYLPPDRRRIDRIGLFRAKSGLRILPEHRFDDEEYNTYACQWHNNLTAAIASFRVAKALMTNPGSRDEIRDFKWHGSHPFRWNAQQLMELGLMEPGQWF